ALDFVDVLKKVIPKLLEYYSYKEDSYNLIIQKGRYSGMSIKHMHMHIIPRNGEDVFQFEENSIYRSFTSSKKPDLKPVIEGEATSKEAMKLKRFFSGV
ncbi:MAG: HIT domain-containing protein, partial [Methanothrix sp.]